MFGDVLLERLEACDRLERFLVVCAGDADRKSFRETSLGCLLLLTVVLRHSCVSSLAPYLFRSTPASDTLFLFILDYNIAQVIGVYKYGSLKNEI
jgi:hypothetical protein